MSGTNPNAQQGPMSAGKGGMRNPGPGGNAQNNPMGTPPAGIGQLPMMGAGVPPGTPFQGFGAQPTQQPQSFPGFGPSQIQPGTPFPNGMNSTGGLTPMQNLQGMLRPSNLMAQQPMPQQSYGAPRPAMPPMGVLSMFNKRG
jgi:hypothetical protein